MSSIAAVAIPPTPPGFGPWERVGLREYERARRDGTPTFSTEFTYDDQFETAFYVAHYRRGK
ncbi:hypothetical protein GS966_20160 [Rhodococcus hoagii]|nr:hypothetical protein [Prescottella equi]NKZ92242.1 hypothetical protein [Prescottella equi]